MNRAGCIIPHTARPMLPTEDPMGPPTPGVHSHRPGLQSAILGRSWAIICCHQNRSGGTDPAGVLDEAACFFFAALLTALCTWFLGLGPEQVHGGRGSAWTAPWAVQASSGTAGTW